jgi:Transposase IS4
MRNRITNKLTIAKYAETFKGMSRGDCTNHTYKYKDDKKKVRTFGFVCWKDRDMVYCLSNNFGTDNFNGCRRRSAVIEEYNHYMGGVDLAEQRQLHCNSTIMGQHRWWLKLMFYLLEVGTTNALVIYNKSMHESMNIFEFKHKIVTSLSESRLDNNKPTILASHALIINPDKGRHICAHCGLTGMFSRTVSAADDCKLQLCSFGNNKLKTEDKQQDCFSLSLANKATQQLCLQRQDKMKLKTNKDCFK